MNDPRMQRARPGRALDVSLAVFDQGKVTVEQLALRERSARETDVAISAAAVCGSDLHTVLGHRETPARTALGHEGVGHVLDADDDASDLRGARLRRGDRVVFALFSACGTCDRCIGGLTMKCRSLVKYGHESVTKPPHATGTLATGVRLLPGVPVLRVPDQVDDEHVVSAGCAVATAAAIVAAAGPPPAGTRVLVLGAGAVGAYCVAMLASLGCSVSVADPSEERLAVAEQLGAKRAGIERSSFPVVVEASGDPEAFTWALGSADIGGRVVAAGSVSPGNSTVTIDPAVLVTRRLTVAGIHNYTAEDFRWGVDWLLAHASTLRLERLVSPPLPLTRVDEAFQRMRDGRHHRVLVRPDDVVE